MGTKFIHNIIVDGWDEAAVKKIHAEAVRLGVCPLTEIVKKPVNGGVTFAVLSDGSQEGWEHRKEEEERRQKLIHMIESVEGMEALVVTWGGDCTRTVSRIHSWYRRLIRVADFYSLTPEWSQKVWDEICRYESPFPWTRDHNGLHVPNGHVEEAVERLTDIADDLGLSLDVLLLGPKKTP